MTPFPLGFSIGTDPSDKNVPSVARVLDFLALAEQLQVERRIQAGLTTGTIFPEAVRRMPGLAGAEAVCAVGGAVADDEGQNSYAIIASAIPPNTASAMTASDFRFPVSLRHPTADNCAW